MLSVPRTWAGVSPSWMSEALSASCPGAVVDRVELDDIDVGTTSRTRAKLHYRSGSGPESVFIKAQGRWDHRLLLASIGGLRPEAWLYAADESLDLEMPVGYASAVDRHRLNTVLVLEDVTGRGGRPNAATTPLTPAQVGSGLDELAKMHAKYWDRPLPPALRFLRPWSLYNGWTVLTCLGGLGLRRLRSAGDDELLPGSVGYGIVKSFARCAAAARTGPQTVLHGDAHVGNSYALPDSKTGFYDWQMIRTGSWMHDVGYFLVSALTIEDRRNSDKQLLHRYLDGLAAAGATPPPIEEAWTRFRSTPIYGLNNWLLTLAVASYQTDAVCRTTIARFAAAYADLESDRALDDISA